MSQKIGSTGEVNSISNDARRRFLKGVGIASGIGVTSGLAGCVGSVSSGDQTLTIGVNNSATGSMQTFGVSFQYAWQAIEKVIEDEGGIDGREVEVITKDNESKPDRSSRIASQFASDDVDLMTTTFGTFLTSPTGPICQKNQLPQISTGSSAPDMHAQYDFMFEGLPVIDHVRELQMLEGKVDTVASLAVDVDFAVLQQELIEENIEKVDLDLVYKDIHPLEESSFKSYILKAQEQGAEALIMDNYANHMIAALRQISSTDYRPKYVQCTTASSASLPEQLDQELLNGLAIHLIWNQARDREGAQKMVQAFQEVSPSNIKIDHYVPLAFVVYQTFKKAVEVLGDDVHDGPTLRDWIADNTVDTAAGISKFDDRGVQTGYGWKPAQWQNNEMKIVYPVNLKQADLIFPKPWP